MIAKKKSRICLHRTWDCMVLKLSVHIDWNVMTESNTNRPRKIVLKLLQFEGKTKIFQNAKATLKETLELRKGLMVAVKRLRKLRKLRCLNYPTIVSRKRSSGVNVKIKIKKLSWVNNNAVRIKFQMFIIRSFFFVRKLYEQQIWSRC